MDRTSSFAAAATLAVATAFGVAAPAGLAQDREPGAGAPLAPAPTEAAPAAPAGDQVYITVIAEERDLRAVIREIERKTGVNIYVEPGIEEVVNVRLVNLPWRQVLDIVARDAGVEVEERGPRLFILSQPPRVSMEFADADIRVVLDLLARQAGKNIVIAKEVGGTVSLNLRNVHWWRALETIVKTAGFVAVRESDDMIRIVLPGSLEVQLTTRVYQLNYLRPPDDYKAVITDREGAAEGGSSGLFVGNPKPPGGIADFTLLQALQRMVGPKESVQYNVESNSFIINATETKHAEIAALFRKIDVEPQQVFVDVKFITTRNSNFWRDGLRLGDPIRNPTDAGVRVGLLTSSAGSESQFPFLIGEGIDLFSSTFQVPAILDFSQMDILLQYVDIDNNTKVTQAPHLLTLNDREAVIFVGEKVPFAEQRATQDQNGNVQVTLSEAGDSPQSVGFTLFITPHIVRDTDQIILTVIPRVTRLTGNQANGLERFTFADPNNPDVQTFIDLPRVADQTVVTKLLVRDQTTAVIGGLMQETITEVEQRIPILSHIPFIGKLFTFESVDYAQENLIIFITPRIVRTGADSTELFQRMYQIHQENDFYYQKYLRDKEGEGRHVQKGTKRTERPTAAGEPLGATPPPEGAGEPAPAGEPPAPAPVGEIPPPPPAPAPEPAPAPAPAPSGPPAPPEGEPAPAPAPAEPPPPPPPASEPQGSAAPQPTTPQGQVSHRTHEQENAGQCRRA